MLSTVNIVDSCLAYLPQFCGKLNKWRQMWGALWTEMGFRAARTCNITFRLYLIYILDLIHIERNMLNQSFSLPNSRQDIEFHIVSGSN